MPSLSGVEEIWGVQRHVDRDDLIMCDNNLNITDKAYVYVGFGGNTSNGRYKFLIYYIVKDKDGNKYDDEHVNFKTEWYYQLLLTNNSGGGGGGGHAYPVSYPSFDDIEVWAYRPQNGDHAQEVTVEIPGIGVSFPLRLNGWSATLEEGEKYGNPSALLQQRSGWIGGNNYEYATGAHIVTTDPCVWYDNSLYGPKLYFEVGIEHDNVDFENPVITGWYLKVGLLALGYIGTPGS